MFSNMTERRGVGLTPMETRREIIVNAAVLADELGYEIFAVPEGWGLDSTPVVAEIALRTTRIQLVSGVLSVWGRTPATLAMTAATQARPLTVAAGPINAAGEDADAARDIVATCTAWYLSARRLRNLRPGPRATPALGPRSRHRHDPAAARNALAQHRSDPPGRSAKRPAGPDARPPGAVTRGNWRCPARRAACAHRWFGVGDSRLAGR